MNYQNLFKIAIRAIAANKMRSFLTALGIIIGIAAVITMLAIGQGSKASIKANIAEMGSNMIMIHPGADMREVFVKMLLLWKLLSRRIMKPSRMNVTIFRPFHLL